MPQITSAITLPNGAAAAKQFTILRKDPTDSVFVEKTRSPNGTPNGWTRLRVRHSPPAGTRLTYVTKIDVDLPVVGVVDGTDKVLRAGGVRVEIFTPGNFTQAERDDLVSYTINALSHASVKPVFQSNDPIY